MCTISQEFDCAPTPFSAQKNIRNSGQTEPIQNKSTETGTPLAQVRSPLLDSGIMQKSAENGYTCDGANTCDALSSEKPATIRIQIDRATHLAHSSSQPTSLVPAKTQGWIKSNCKKSIQDIGQTSHSEAPFLRNCPQMDQRAGVWRSTDSGLAGEPRGNAAQLELLNAIQAVVAAITPEERAQLTQFARHRLAHFGMNLGEADDLYQHSISAVLTGGAKKRGRKPNSADLANRAAFQNYLRGVINSVVEGWARRHHRVTKRTHPLHPLESVLPTSPATWTQIEFTDMQAQLFGRLRKLAPARLLPTIDAWQKAPDERIPCITSRKHVCSVRQLAQQIAPALGLERPSTRRAFPAGH